MVSFSNSLLFLGAGAATIVINAGTAAASPGPNMEPPSPPSYRRSAQPVYQRSPQDSSSSDVGEEFTGDGTYYSPSVGTGACGWDNTDEEFVAALNADQFGSPANPNASPFCGRNITVTGPKGSVNATIVDKCPVCHQGDIDLSPTAFDQIADQAEGRVPISWTFVD
ncbi:hypothetical protein IWQ60_010515 [Tieghemiomyces parasiticus]|uniref:RlpA-like protein double-psi beta-barrel domain-containing protein n=1 Tax=Tieghemiomyces parasiticus TaxID=78921 RepID=A0A9W7ZKX8_9FUNG|nr:hypothetical protein IWQ60_010515 [Tieghemiomyces parasiticus]